MTPAIQTTTLPLGPVAVNAVGTLLLMAGALGLFVPGAISAMPALADPAIAWIVLVLGGVLDAWACLAIVQRLRRKPQ